MDWQPIETAPRDGTMVRVRDDELGPVEMRWNPSGYNTLVSRSPGIWESPCGDVTWCEDDGFGPTQWKPLNSPKRNGPDKDVASMPGPVVVWLCQETGTLIAHFTSGNKQLGQATARYALRGDSCPFLKRAFW